jgi:hypothetical protein
MKKTFLCLVIAFAITTVVSAQGAETAPDAAPAAPAAAAAPASNAVELGGGKFTLGLYFNSGFDIGWGSEARRGDAYKDAQEGSGYGNGLSTYAHDADVDGYRGQLDLGYDHKDWGLKLRARSQANTTGGTARSFGDAFSWVFLHYGYVWYKPSDAVKVSGGIVDDNAWRTGGPINDDAVGQDRGALFNFYPVQGLDAGFGVFDNGPGSVVVLGAGYKTDAFVVRASTRFGRANISSDSQHTDLDYNTLFAGGVGLTDSFHKAFLGFGLTAVDNLTLVLESKIWVERGNYNYEGHTSPKVKVGLNGAYEAGDVTVGAKLWYYANNYTEGEKGEISGVKYKRYNHVNSTYDADANGGYLNDASDFGFVSTNGGIGEHLIDFVFNPYVSYKLKDGKIEPGFGFTVGVGGVPELQQYVGTEGGGGGYSKSKVSEVLLKVNPNVVFHVGENASFDIGYEYAFASQTVEKGTGDNKAFEQVGQKSTISLDFLISY